MYFPSEPFYLLLFVFVRIRHSTPMFGSKLRIRVVSQQSQLHRRPPVLRVYSVVRKFSAPLSKPEPARPRSRLIYLVALSAAAGVGLAAYFFIPNGSISAPTYYKKPLSPTYFTPVTLTSSEHCGPDAKLLMLTIPPHLLPPRDDPSIFAPIWSIFIKDDDIQVERPYTPLEGVDEEGHMLFWIKQYEKGEVGRWLHSKKVGDTVEIRGPLKTWTWQDEAWDDVVMVRSFTGSILLF